jgi:hypothetical protein
MAGEIGSAGRSFRELVLVAFHVDAPTPESNAFTFEAKALFNGVISAQLDLPARAQDAMPGQTNGSVQSPGHQSCAAAQTSGARNGAIGGDFAMRDGANEGQDLLPGSIGG